MNCRNFETVMTDLARGLLMEASAREDGLAHAEGCERCAARLEDERHLTISLACVAQSAKNEEAPARTEAALLAAFRERKAAEAAPLRIYAPASHTHRWTRWATGVAAAVVFAIFALVAVRLQQTPAEKQDHQASGSRPTTAQQLANASITPGTTPPPFSSGTQPTVSGPEETRPSRRAPVRTRNSMFRDNTGLISNKASVPSNTLASTESKPNEAEIMTEFLPLRYGDNLASLDSGRVVRVEMPRTTLASFGLPMNPELSGERVKADVLLGEDGMARAIRFVR